ncbi:MAG: 3'-5' exonuclease [Nitrospinota bacterium]
MKKQIFFEKKAVIFDLEITAWPGTSERNWSKPNEYKEIIQIGAVAIETEGSMREIGSFHILIRPIKNPQLSDYIIDLTGITQDMIDREGVPFPKALSRFTKFIGEDPIHIFCNGDDSDVIAENCKIHGMEIPTVFRQSSGLRLYFSETLGLPEKICNSAQLPELCGLVNNEKAHNALGDARSISQALRHLQRKD